MSIKYPLLIYQQDKAVNDMMYTLDLGWEYPKKALAWGVKYYLEYKEGEKVTKGRISKMGKKLAKLLNEKEERYKVIGIIDLWHRNLIYKDESIIEI